MHSPARLLSFLLITSLLGACGTRKEEPVPADAGTVEPVADAGIDPCLGTDANLIGDGEFAAGLQCWQSFGQGVSGGGFTIDPEHPESSSAPSLRAENDTLANKTWDSRLWQSGVKLQQGQTYRIAFWARAAAERDILVLLMRPSDPEATRFPFAETLRVGVQWRKFERFVTLDRGAEDGQLEFQFGEHSTAAVWLDGVELGPTPNPCVPNGENLVRDGEFEAGFRCWKAYGNGVAEAGFATSDEHPASTRAPSMRGENSEVGNDYWDTTLYQEGLKLTQGQSYKLTFWARAEKARNFLLMVHASNLAGAPWFFSDHVGVSTQWKKHERYFTATSTTDSGKLDFQLGSLSDAAVLIDGVELTPSPDPCAPNGANLVRNGEFGSGLACWYSHGWSIREGGFGPDVDHPAASLAPSLRAENELVGNGLADTVLDQGGLDLVQGQTYRLSFWVRAQAERTIRFMVHKPNPQPGQMFHYETLVVGAQWKKVERFLTFGESITNASLAFQFGEVSTAAVFLDAVELTPSANPCAPSGGNLLGDGDFDHGTACWVARGRGGNEGGYTVDADHPTGESAPSLRAENDVVGNNLWDTQLYQTGINLSQGETYRLSYWLRAQAPRTIAVLVHEFRPQPGLMHHYEVVNVTSQWQRFEREFTVSANAPDSMVEFQFGETSTLPVWVDSVQLSVKPPPTR